jgi:hypothetical protein
LNPVSVTGPYGNTWYFNSAEDFEGGDVFENDESVADVDGDTCSSFYDSNPDGCGNYDTEEFIAARDCCVCGGGSTGNYSDWDYDYEVCENDESISDIDGDTCSSYYDANPEGCGEYDTEDFIAARECCVCSGGSTGYYEEDFSWYMYLTSEDQDAYAMIWTEDEEFNTMYVCDESGAICTLTTDWINATNPE